MQLYFPEWEQYEAAMRGIVDRKCYTNHGPLVRELEARLEDFLRSGTPSPLRTATSAFISHVSRWDWRARSSCPFTFIAAAQAAVLAGLDPVLCDVDPALTR